MSEFRAAQLRLYLVLDPAMVHGDPLETARASIAAGITCLQLRWKNATDREILQLARPLAAACGGAAIPFIVNDRVDLALAAGAQGTHLGVDDLPVPDARALGGPEFIVGYSPETGEQLRNAADSGATYLGIGPFASTSTKHDAGEALGAAEFSRRRSLTTLPVVAIGGIGEHNACAAIGAGAEGIAVVSAIAAAAVPADATRALARQLSSCS